MSAIPGDDVLSQRNLLVLRQKITGILIATDCPEQNRYGDKPGIVNRIDVLVHPLEKSRIDSNFFFACKGWVSGRIRLGHSPLGHDELNRCKFLFHAVFEENFPVIQISKQRTTPDSIGQPEKWRSVVVLDVAFVRGKA